MLNCWAKNVDSDMQLRMKTDRIFIVLLFVFYVGIFKCDNVELLFTQSFVNKLL